MHAPGRIVVLEPQNKLGGRASLLAEDLELLRHEKRKERGAIADGQEHGPEEAIDLEESVCYWSGKVGVWQCAGCLRGSWGRRLRGRSDRGE